MPTIIFSPSAQLLQVEDFPADTERTVKGALYVRPGATSVVSDGEAAHLKKLGIAFTVSGAPKVAALPAPKPPLAPSLPVASLPSPSVPAPGSAPTGASKSSDTK
jgi:hypothetical protein